MKIAFVHDRIIEEWWAEQVLKDWIKNYIEKYPDAEFRIFTTFFRWKKIWRNSEEIWRIKINNIYIPVEYIFLVNENNKILFRPLQTIFWSLPSTNYRNLLPFFPILQKILSKKIKKFNPDIVFISSFAIAKNIDLPNSAKQITLYLHSPMQYIWEMYEEYLNKFWFFKRQIFKITASVLRKWDLKKSKRLINDSKVKIFYNSYYTQKTAKKIYWRKTWKVIYPKIDNIFINRSVQNKILDYFVFVWRTVKFAKELDKIINLFNKTGDNLLIIWDWPDKEELKTKAGPNIIFLWKIQNKEILAKIVSQSRWLINLTKESFWLATAEALAMGVPVFAYGEGGSYELILWIENLKNVWRISEEKRKKRRISKEYLKYLKKHLKQDFQIFNSDNYSITKFNSSSDFPQIFFGTSLDFPFLRTSYGLLIFDKSPQTILKWFEIFKNTNFDRKKIKENFIKFLKFHF